MAHYVWRLILIVKADSRPPFLARTFGSHSVFVPRFLSNSFAWIRSQLPSLDPKDLLPLGIEVEKGAIVIGNESTPSLLVAEFARSEGTYGVVSVCCMQLFLGIDDLYFPISGKVKV